MIISLQSLKATKIHIKFILSIGRQYLLVPSIFNCFNVDFLRFGPLIRTEFYFINQIGAYMKPIRMLSSFRYELLFNRKAFCHNYVKRCFMQPKYSFGKGVGASRLTTFYTKAQNVLEHEVSLQNIKMSNLSRLKLQECGC